MLLSERDAAVVHAALVRSDARLSLVVAAVNGGLWHVDIAKGSFECSPQLVRLFTGSETGTLESDDLLAMIDEVDRDYASFFELIVGKLDRKTVEYHVKTPAGRRLLVCDGLLLRDTDGSPIEVIGLVRDITEERAQQTAVQQQADTDPLTGLLNRRGLERRIDALRAATPLGVAIIDLDGFKPINDRYGHHTGDLVLVETAVRLRQAVRELDILARLGGDEFLIALPGADETVLARVATSIQASLQEEALAGVRIGASVGAAVGQIGETSFAEIISEADRMLYRAKAKNRRVWAKAG
jgi:diguanylate cyclase (GGDEF)-like protein